MSNFRKKYGRLPTIMSYMDQVAIMKELISIGASKLLLDVDDMMYILDALQGSHQGNGAFEFNEKDRGTFMAFIDLLREIGAKNPELSPCMEEGMVGTFEAMGFDDPEQGKP